MGNQQKRTGIRRADGATDGSSHHHRASGLKYLSLFRHHQAELLQDPALWPVPAAGPENYIEMFTSPEFWRANLNTLYFCVLTVPLGFFSLNRGGHAQRENQGESPSGPSSSFPWSWPPPLWPWCGNGCSTRNTASSTRSSSISWITDPNIIMVTCAIVAIWSSIGYDAVLLLSGLQNISKSYYEAASLDGAEGAQFLHHLPMISPTLFVVLIMRLMSSLKVYDLSTCWWRSPTRL